MARIDDFLEMFFKLLPPGDLLTHDHDSNLGNLFYPFARELERLEQQSEFIIPDMDPSITSLFLLDWERVLGLPECGLELGTVQERRAAASAKLTTQGNLSIEFMEAICLAFGFDVTITTSATVDHQFDVDLPSFTILEFRTGTSVTGDRLGAWGGVDELTCLLDRIKPAWTTYILTSP